MIGLGWIWLAGLAWAGDVDVESASFQTREEAMTLFQAMEETLGQDGDAQPRLVRRYQQNEGWRYVVVVEGLEDQQANDLCEVHAVTVVGATEGRTPAPATTVTNEPRAISEVAEQPSVNTVPAAEPTVQQRISPRSQPPTSDSAEAVLRAAARAHGGGRTSRSRFRSAESLQFVYVRAVPVQQTTLVAHNTYTRSGDAVRLDVRIQEGEGTDSTTVLTADGQGYLQVDGEITSRDGGRTLELLERFSPEALLAFPLGLPEDIHTAAAWQGLVVVAQSQTPQGEEQWGLAANDGDRGLGLQGATFANNLLTSVQWKTEEAELLFGYADYHPVSEDLNIMIPHHVRIERDGVLLEEIRVESIAFNLGPNPELFTVPAGD